MDNIEIQKIIDNKMKKMDELMEDFKLEPDPNIRK